MTKHKDDCTRVFKRYDMSCPRCKELASGSKPREGWQRPYYASKELAEQNRSLAIKNHDCKASGCGPVCTAFDW